MVRVARAGCILASLILGVCWALRAVAVGAETRHFDVPAGPSGPQLDEFGRQAGLTVIYDPVRVAGCNTGALRGDFERPRALDLLLDGTGLVGWFTTDHSVSVIPRAGKERCEPVASAPEQSVLPASGAPTASESVETNPTRDVLVAARLVRSDVPTPPGVPLTRITAEDFEKRGAATIVEWSHTLTSQSGASPSEGLRGVGREVLTNSGYGEGLNLRGLGSRATLVLLNGRRLAPSGSAGTFTDVANIPLSAIDHIDVISSGASTFYGADAIAGVVNFVTRVDTAAPASQVMFGGLTRGDPNERKVSQSWPLRWESGGARLAVEYYERDALLASDRGRATSNLTAWGGNNWDTPAGNPGTLIDGSARVWAIPTGQPGTGLKVSDLISGTNVYNRFDGATLLPHQQRFSLVATGQQRVAEDATAWFSSFLSHRSFAAQAAGLTTILNVPRSNPWYVNPTAGAVVQEEYGFGKDLGPIKMRGRVDVAQLGMGLSHSGPGKWLFNADVGYAAERQHDIDDNLVNFDAFQVALANPDPHVAFNSFADGSYTNPATLAAIRARGRMNYNSAYTTANLTGAGPLWALPAGDLTLSVGMNVRFQTLKSAIDGPIPFTSTPSTNGHRRMIAGFAEANIPVVGPASAGAPHRLDLSVGIRDEHYSDTGHTPAPQIGLTYSPSQSVTFLSNWSRLYRPPNLPDLSETSNLSAFVFLPDPKNPAGVSTVLGWTGGNSHLRPESAETWNAEMEVHRSSQPETYASLTYFHIVFENQVQNFNLPLNAMTDPKDAWLVSRNPTTVQQSDVCNHTQFTGALQDCLSQPISAIVDVRLHNALTLVTDGFEMAGQYEWQAPIGRLRLGLHASYVLHYGQANTPTSPLVELRDTAHNPVAVRMNGTATWDYRGFWGTLQVNYQGGYTNTDNVVRQSVRPWTTWDMIVGVPLGWQGLSLFRQMRLLLRCQNIFNASPPFLNNAAEATSYDEENANLLGRRASVQIDFLL